MYYYCIEFLYAEGSGFPVYSHLPVTWQYTNDKE